MKAIVSAGGTGGHIYPALAIINKIKEKEPNSEILYIGTHNRMEKDIIPKYNIPFEAIEMYGLNRKNILKNFKVLWCLKKAYSRCKKMIKDFNPDVVIGVGGYVTVPVIKQAKKLGYKTFIHEQNSVPGKANKFLIKYVDKIATSFPSSLSYFPREKVIVSGNPCSEDAIKVIPALKKEFGLKEDKKLIIIVMGSLGSSKINDFFMQTMALFANKEYEVLFITGANDYDKVVNSNIPSNVKVVPFVDKMPRIMKKADLIVSRAGATTISEIIALELPSILIPSPYVPNNHQEKNAQGLIKEKAALLIKEENLSGDILVKTIDNIIFDNTKLENIKVNLRKLKINDSALIIYNSIRELIDGK